MTAHPLADRSESSGLVQGVDDDYTEEALFVTVTSEVPVMAARQQEISLVLQFTYPVSLTRVHLLARCSKLGHPDRIRFSVCGADAMDMSLPLAKG